MHVCVSVIKRTYSYTFLSTPGSCEIGHHKLLLLARVSTRVVVVVVVVRELFSLVTSAICVRIRGHGSEVMRIVYHMAPVFVYCCILTTVDS